MKPILPIILSGLLLLTAMQVWAQETYFNVPESEITEKNKLLIQQQVDFSDLLRSATTVNYGLGRNWEIGANLYNLNYEPELRRLVRNDSSSQMPYAPLLLLNVQKIFELTHQVHIGLGAQGGANLTPVRGRSLLVGYAYINLAGTLQQKHYKWSAGGYTSNARFLGGEPQIGVQGGFDAGIFYEKLHLIGDWISGAHELGQLVLGLEVFPGKSFPLAIGWQRANRDGSQGVVIQLSYVPQN